MMMLKKGKWVRHGQFCRARPSYAVTPTSILFSGVGTKLDLSEAEEVC